MLRAGRYSDSRYDLTGRPMLVRAPPLTPPVATPVGIGLARRGSAFPTSAAPTNYRNPPESTTLFAGFLAWFRTSCKSGSTFNGGRRVGLGFLGCASALLVASCATTSEPRLVTKEVRVPVPVACSADPGPEPSYSDTPEALRAAADVFEAVKLLLAGRAQRDARLTELQAANAGCRQ